MGARQAGAVCQKVGPWMGPCLWCGEPDIEWDSRSARQFGSGCPRNGRWDAPDHFHHHGRQAIHEHDEKLAATVRMVNTLVEQLEAGEEPAG
jgi:hypothetical protein